jgi:hypothetical protein
MWRVIVGSLTAVFIVIGQAWAMPTDVSTVGVLNCGGSCQAGTTLTAARLITGDTSNPEGASFQDHYSFVLTGPVDLSGKAYGLNFTPTFNIENLSFTLFDPSLSPLGSAIAVPNGSGVQFASFSFSGLVSGAYTLLVSGLIPQAYGGGQYLLSGDFTQAAVSSVPVPAAMWLFVSALIGMFSLTQMRKRSPLA